MKYKLSDIGGRDRKIEEKGESEREGEELSNNIVSGDDPLQNT